MHVTVEMIGWGVWAREVEGVEGIALLRVGVHRSLKDILPASEADHDVPHRRIV